MNSPLGHGVIDDERLLTQSNRIDVGIFNTGPDAGAGSPQFEPGADRSAGAASARSRPGLRLPIQGRGVSNVASAGLAQLEKALSDTATLQKHAHAAIDRIGKQQAALRRFAMACPGCGALNAPPSGAAWGSGDICSCQECGLSFVPIGQGFQDSDLNVLRTAVNQLKTSTERIQVLEQIVDRGKCLTCKCGPGSSAATPASGGSGNGLRFQPPTAPQSGSAGERNFVAVSPVVQTPSCDRISSSGQPTGKLEQPSSSSLAFSGPAKPSPHSSTTSFGPSSWRPSTRSPSRRLCDELRKEDDQLQAAQPSSISLPAGLQNAEFGPATGKTPQAPSHGRLMALMDTHDLCTSSSGGSDTPCFQGRRVQQWDTEQDALEALDIVRQNMSKTGGSSNPHGFHTKDREEGELTSASESDAGSQHGTWDLRPPKFAVSAQPPLSRTFGGELQRPPTERPLSPPKGPRLRSPPKGHVGAANANYAEEAEGQSILVLCSALFDGPQRHAAGRLVAVVTAVAIMRASLLASVGTLDVGESATPALLAAGLAACALCIFRSARSVLEVQQMMDTAPVNQRQGVVTFRIGGPYWTLWSLDVPIEEVFGLSCVLGHFALLFFFENWGLHGPPSWRWGAVLAHAALAACLVFVAHSWLTSEGRLPNNGLGGGIGVVWLCISVGNWLTTSWAAVTWWCVAAATTSGKAYAYEDGGSAVAPQVRAPIIALAGAHIVNFWLARRVQQPVLLSLCTVLAGISMALCCSVSHGRAPQAQFSLVPAPWTPAIYSAFCILAAWVLWQELIKSL